MKNYYLTLLSAVTMLFAGCGKDDLPTVELTGAAADKAALIKIHEACGGWRNDTNWGTDEPLDDWSGVMTNSEGRVVRLYFDEEGGPSGDISTGELTELTSLTIINNHDVTTLDVTQNSKLEYLNVGDTPITSLDLSKNSELTTLWTIYSKITSLDVSNNPKLTELIYTPAPNSILEEITTSINYLFDPDDISGCGEQDDALYTAPHHYDGRQYPVYTFKDLDQDAMNASVAADKATLLALIADEALTKDSELDFSSWNESDPLTEWNYVTTDLFGRVIELEIEGLGGAFNLSVESGALSALRDINIPNGTLESLTLSELPALESLNCYLNSISSLSISDLPNLEKLVCYRNSISSLSLSNLPNLYRLDCDGNQLTSLTLTDLPALCSLSCNNNNLLTELSLTNLPALCNLSCIYNNLTSLTLTNLPALDHIDCIMNNFTSLTFAELPQLSFVRCDDNHNLTSLDVSKLSNLESLYCESTKIETLDVSKNEKISELTCGKSGDDYIKEVILPSTKAIADFDEFTTNGWGEQDEVKYPEPNYYNGYQYPEIKYGAAE